MGCNFARRPLQIAMQKQIQMWIRNGSTTCRCVMTSVKKAATSWNSWSCFFTQVTTVRKSTPWWMRQLGSLIFTLVSCLVGFFPVETAPVFFSQFLSGQAGHLKVKHGSQRGFQQNYVRIASHRFDARSQTKLSHLWWKIEILSHGVHRCSYGVYMGPWPVTFHPYPQICKIITNTRFSIVFILGKPFDKMM